jgi:hypothetical protein
MISPTQILYVCLVACLIYRPNQWLKCLVVLGGAWWSSRFFYYDVSWVPGLLACFITVGIIYFLPNNTYFNWCLLLFFSLPPFFSLLVSSGQILDNPLFIFDFWSHASLDNVVSRSDFNFSIPAYAAPGLSGCDISIPYWKMLPPLLNGKIMLIKSCMMALFIFFMAYLYFSNSNFLFLYLLTVGVVPLLFPEVKVVEICFVKANGDNEIAVVDNDSVLFKEFIGEKSPVGSERSFIEFGENLAPREFGSESDLRLLYHWISVQNTSKVPYNQVLRNIRLGLSEEGYFVLSPLR